MVSNLAAIIRFLAIMLSFVRKDLSTDCIVNANCIISSYFDELVKDSHYYTSCFVRELLLLRDKASVLSNYVVLKI